CWGLPLEYSFVQEFGKKGNTDGEFLYPACLTIDRYGSIYVTDWDNFRIVKFTREGVFSKNIEINESQRKKHGLKNKIKPIGVISTQHDQLYVTDYNNHCLLIFDLMGDLIKICGGFGKENGKMQYPRGLGADAQGNVFVADYNNSRIQKFDRSGNFLLDIKTVVDKKSMQPRSLALTESGEIWVVMSSANLVVRMDQTGKVLKKIGKPGSGGGEFNEPRYIAVDVMGNLYVTDYNNHRVQLFSAEGIYFGEFGTKGKARGEFDSPEGIWVDYNGNLLVVDARNQRVQEFGAPPLTNHKYLSVRFYNIGLRKEAFNETMSVLNIAPDDSDALARVKELGIYLINEAIASNDQKRGQEIFQGISRFFPADSDIQALEKKLSPSSTFLGSGNNDDQGLKLPKNTSNMAIEVASALILIVIITLVVVISRKKGKVRRKKRKKPFDAETDEGPDPIDSDEDEEADDNLPKS
ncbi:MAG: NHL repeat-containing protein, partial [Candidatus Wallbacteria bacterium]|nr:NHL repeat-containing protein [Candidatus Wallbacteria bacterium]